MWTPNSILSRTYTKLRIYGNEPLLLILIMDIGFPGRLRPYRELATTYRRGDADGRVWWWWWWWWCPYCGYVNVTTFIILLRHNCRKTWLPESLHKYTIRQTIDVACDDAIQPKHSANRQARCLKCELKNAYACGKSKQNVVHKDINDALTTVQWILYLLTKSGVAMML